MAKPAVSLNFQLFEVMLAGLAQDVLFGLTKLMNGKASSGAFPLIHQVG